MTLPPIPDPKNPGWRTSYGEATIAAPRQKVWEVLTDFAAYDEWNPFTYDIHMPEFAPGEPFRFTVRMTDSYIRTQREILHLIEAPHFIAWGFPHPTIFLDPVRYQVLTETPEGYTRYQTWETFTGLLSPIVSLAVVGAVSRGFQDMADSLKQRVESMV